VNERRLVKSGMRKYSPVGMKPGAMRSTWFSPRTALVIPTDLRVGEEMKERNCLTGKIRKR